MFDDLKFALRRLRNSPGFTVTSVLILTLAIGANTAIFSIADAALFRPLPYHDPANLHIIQMLNRQTGQKSTSVPSQFLQAVNQSAEIGEAGYPIYVPPLTAISNDGARSLPTLAVSTNYFKVLGIRPARGRLFASHDDLTSGRPVVLTYSTWQQQFGGDEKIVGGSITLGTPSFRGPAVTYVTASFDVIGVLPAGFVFPSTPLAGNPEVITVMATADQQADTRVHPILRLKPGVTREQAQARLGALFKPFAVENPRTTDVRPVLEEVRSILYPAGRSIMAFLLAGAALVLLLGCSNLAILYLARIKRNEIESGIRIALGATRLRLLRPLVFETAIVSLVGTLAAVLVTLATFNALVPSVPPIAYGSAAIGVDLRVVLFALGLGLFSGLIFSVVPVWRTARLDAQELIQGRRPGSKGRSGGFGRPLVAIQVSLAIALVFGAVIVGRSFLALVQTPLGFDPENVITINFNTGKQTGIERQEFYIHAIESIANHSEVISVGAVGTSLPLSGAMPEEPLTREGSTESLGGIFHALPGYFEAAGIPLIRGRLLNWDDVRGGATAAIVSESAARKLFPATDPIGGMFSNGRKRRFIVVGVVADVLSSLGDGEYPVIAYVIPGESTRFLKLVVRTRTRNDSLLSTLRREIGKMAYGVPVTVHWWSDSISALTVYRNPRFQTLIMGGFAGLALILTAIGTFSVVSFAVASRTHEMGVRLALGATSRSLVNLMIKRMLVSVAAGLVIGFVLTRWLSEFAEAQLFQVNTGDPITLGMSGLLVIAVAILAALLPARRAGRVDPLAVLKAE